MNWQNRSASDLGRGIAAGEIDPVELTEAFLEATQTHPEHKRIYARMTETRALAEAEAARERAQAGLRRHPLDGVPMSWKDLFDTADVATEAGSALLQGRVPERDAKVLATATAQGSICLGKTHMTELAFSGLGLNPITATSPNALDPKLAPGGSSSGSAVSVALGLAAASVGSDTGGSVRLPAAWNSLVGLKTTSGRLSLQGVVPLAAKFDTIGPLTRTVEDAALMLSLLEGSKPIDLAETSLKGLRLAVLENGVDGAREQPTKAFEAGVVALAKAGAKITRIRSSEVETAFDSAGILFAAEAYGTWKHAIEAAPEKMYPAVCERFRGGKDFLAADYVAAWQKLDDLRTKYLAATAEYDAVILPTAPNLPPETERLLADQDYFMAENLLTLRNTRIGNLMGLAGLTLPTSLPHCGMMFLGPPMSEERLLRMGKAAEPVLVA